ncbi:MAG: PIG-L family deacetylase [Kiritimatiellae bacterium]|nr:PIG-L family deacetylase [Kiritimatiellia bacterium]
MKAGTEPDPDTDALRVGVVVAHPDDETLWAGGTLLLHPAWQSHLMTLCRASDPDRAPRFHRAARALGATGALADLDDGPEQRPLPQAEVADTVRTLTADREFDLLLTHGPHGEYTRHRRHEEACAAVLALWQAGQLAARAVWLFAYEDGGRRYLPRPAAAAHQLIRLPPRIWRRKYEIVTQIYGFDPRSFEARTTPRAEAFWPLASPTDAVAWLQEERG